MIFFREVYKMCVRPTNTAKLINVKDRSMICSLRISSYQMMSEKGRHNNIPEIERTCTLCKNVVENEIHFPLNCACYKCHRTYFENKIVANC